MSPTTRVFADVKNKTFGSMVREVRLSRGIAQQDLAEQLGISTATLYNVETDRSVSVPLMIALMDALDISVEFHVGAVDAADTSPMNELLDVASMVPTSMVGFVTQLVKAAVTLRTVRKRELLLAFTQTLPVFDTSSSEE